MIVPSGRVDARMMIVADCVSYRDLQSNTILNDREYERMMSEAGVDRNACFTTALIRGPIRGQNFDLQVAPSQKAVTPDHTPLHNKMVRRELIPYVEALRKDICLVKPKIILAFGNGALFALTGKWGIKAWRGSIIDYITEDGHTCKIIPTYPVSFVQSVWKERNTVIFDIRKAWGHAITDKPLIAPKYDFIIEPSFPTVMKTLDMLMAKIEAGPTRISADIETVGGHITCLGLAWSALEALCIPFIRAVYLPSDAMHYWHLEEETFIVYKLYKLLTHPNCQVIGQNFLYDAQYIYRHFHFIPNFKRDTMLAQHTMFSSMPKSLDFLSSLHTNYHVYWKNMHKVELKKDS